MFDDIRKSISATLYDRISSPLYGSLVVSWCLWNWKIIYLTLFVDEKNLPITKLDHIIKYYNTPLINYVFPLASAAAILFVIPYFSNWVYEISIKFDKERYDKKIEVEKSKMLTLEDSVELRLQYSRMEEQYEKAVRQKEQEAIDYKTTINGLNRLIEEHNQIRILRAWYGTKENRVDVTNVLQNLTGVSGTNFMVSNEILGVDPAPGQLKKLEAIYEVNRTVSYHEVQEGHNFSITKN